MSEDGELVELYVYDLSGGLAQSLSPALLGQQIDAIYHTSIVVSGFEHYFGGGINVAPAGTTPFGNPLQRLPMGRTQLPQDVRELILADLSERYTPESYSLFSNNCNNFSNELSQLLTGRAIPSNIITLPDTVLATPFGALLRPMLGGLEEQMRSMRQHQAFVNPNASSGIRTHTEEDAAAHASSPPPGRSQEEGGSAIRAECDSLLAAEHEIERTVAETILSDLDEKIEDLDLKEGRNGVGLPRDDAAVARFAAETAVKKEYDRLIAECGMSVEDAEIAAVESVAADAEAAAHKTQTRPL